MSHISKQSVRYGLTSVHHEHFEGPRCLAWHEAIRAGGQLLHPVFFAGTGRQVEDMIESGVHTWFSLGAST